MVADNSSEVAAICSAADASARPVRSASARVASDWAAIWPCSSDCDCCWMADCASPAPADCSSAAAATCSAPFRASSAARSASSAAFSVACAPSAISAKSARMAVRDPTTAPPGLGFGHRLVGGGRHRRDDAAHVRLDGFGQTLNVLRAFFRRLRQSAHLLGHNRKAATMIAARAQPRSRRSAPKG